MSSVIITGIVAEKTQQEIQEYFSVFGSLEMVERRTDGQVVITFEDFESVESLFMFDHNFDGTPYTLEQIDLSPPMEVEESPATNLSPSLTPIRKDERDSSLEPTTVGSQRDHSVSVTRSVASEEQEEVYDNKGLTPPNNVMYPRYSPFKIFIGKLSPDMTEPMLFEAFSKFGPILKAEIKLDNNTQVSKGYGFVIFENILSAQKACSGGPCFVGYHGNKRHVDVKSCIEQLDPGAEGWKAVESHRNGLPEAATNQVVPEGCKKIFVGGLPWDCVEKTLRDHFCKFGHLTRVELPTHPGNGRPKGFAFIHFAEDDHVKNVFKTPYHILAGKRVDVKAAYDSVPVNPKFAQQSPTEQPMMMTQMASPADMPDFTQFQQPIHTARAEQVRYSPY